MAAVSDRQASHASFDGRVALLIDFENLVRGMAGEDSIDCELLFRLAEDYGRVLLANAYADWPPERSRHAACSAFVATVMPCTGASELNR
jgi:hypothetical protein